MNVASIRQKFLDFFASKGHTIVASSALVPANDPTLLFTNSGMVQFKDVFLGQESRPYKRATTSQRSLRAGGKHNDLENVGYTARHHTFFEMLGNFSFGDYFKTDAIHFAWELLTRVYGLPAEKLWVTVYFEDDEAYNIWHNEIKVPAQRIIRIGDNKGARYASDNFWQMADTGPCGPCSEIFYDHGADVQGGPPGSADEDGDRYIEIWNLVFMQFNRDETGTLHPLPRPCVDTGMGLERIAAVLQHVHSNYEIDLFAHLITAVAQKTRCADLTEKSLRVIADHLRACAFLIVDGIIPGNEGRGYVLRRIIRRAIRHGYKLGMRAPFFNQLVPALVTEMGAAYPELMRTQDKVVAVLLAEEMRFFETLENGMDILHSALASNPKNLAGDIAFKLHDTFGFPLDLTADICREQGIELDLAGFDAAMARQRDQARAAGRFKANQALTFSGPETEFKGYTQLTTDNSTVLALYHEGTAVEVLETGQTGIVVLAQTPFYAESGGQVGDSGRLFSPAAEFNVDDTQKIQSQVFGHYGVLERGTLRVGQALSAAVDIERRQHTMRHHSATHLLHLYLREVLGSHVQQKGSLVDATRTRFDFTHPSALTEDQLTSIERHVNQAILSNQPTQVREMSFDDATATGAVALFGEKYDDTVRVLDIGPSRELCGGTHVTQTGDIGLFRITSESGVAAGIRRIEAVCGTVSLSAWQAERALLTTAATRLKSSPAELAARIDQMLQQQKSLEQQLQQTNAELARSQWQQWWPQAVPIAGGHLIVRQINSANSAQLRLYYDAHKAQTEPNILIVACDDGLRASVLVGVSAALTSHHHAGKIVETIVAQLGGKGGGKADMAQGGGPNRAALAAALAQATQTIAAA